MHEIRVDGKDVESVAKQLEGGFQLVLDQVANKPAMTPLAMGIVMSYLVSSFAGRMAALIGPAAAASVFQKMADAMRDEAQKASGRKH